MLRLPKYFNIFHYQLNHENRIKYSNEGKEIKKRKKTIIQNIYGDQPFRRI